MLQRSKKVGAVLPNWAWLVALIASFGSIETALAACDCMQQISSCMLSCAGNPNCILGCSQRGSACSNRCLQELNADDDSAAESSAALSGSGRDEHDEEDEEDEEPSHATRGGPSSKQLGSLCNARCASETSSCRNGTMSACYRAEACQYGCFLDEVPDSPSRSDWRRRMQDATAKADAMRSDRPVFNPYAEPEPTYTPPATTPSPPRRSCRGCADAAR